MATLKVGVLISGRGSNLRALIDGCAGGRIPAEIVLVISNRPEAAGLDHARRANIPTRIIDHRQFADRATFDTAMTDALRAAGVELLCLAGFMRLLSPGFVATWRNRMINIHPSLLPAFAGLHTHERALQAGCKVAGSTVHFVTAELDHGPIVLQAAVPVRVGDTADTLAARVLRGEHIIYPRAVRWFVEGRVALGADGVVRQTEAAPQWLFLDGDGDGDDTDATR